MHIDEAATKTCPACDGSGRLNPVFSGGNSDRALNQWLMQQTCGFCKGEKVVPADTEFTEQQRHFYKDTHRGND